jgi:hypothetical protein
MRVSAGGGRVLLALLLLMWCEEARHRAPTIAGTARERAQRLQNAVRVCGEARDARAAGARAKLPWGCSRAESSQFLTPQARARARSWTCSTAAGACIGCAHERSCCTRLRSLRRLSASAAGMHVLP